MEIKEANHYSQKPAMHNSKGVEHLREDISQGLLSSAKCGGKDDCLQ